MTSTSVSARFIKSNCGFGNLFACLAQVNLSLQKVVLTLCCRSMLEILQILQISLKFQRFDRPCSVASRYLSCKDYPSRYYW